MLTRNIAISIHIIAIASYLNPRLNLRNAWQQSFARKTKFRGSIQLYIANYVFPQDTYITMTCRQLMNRETYMHLWETHNITSMQAADASIMQEQSIVGYIAIYNHLVMYTHIGHPYAYGPIYAYGAEQAYHKLTDQLASQLCIFRLIQLNFLRLFCTSHTETKLCMHGASYIISMSYSIRQLKVSLTSVSCDYMHQPSSKVYS